MLLPASASRASRAAAAASSPNRRASASSTANSCSCSAAISVLVAEPCELSDAPLPLAPSPRFGAEPSSPSSPQPSLLPVPSNRLLATPSSSSARSSRCCCCWATVDAEGGIASSSVMLPALRRPLREEWRINPPRGDEAEEVSDFVGDVHTAGAMPTRGEGQSSEVS